jgi:hypothetical protein
MCESWRVGAGEGRIMSGEKHLVEPHKLSSGLRKCLQRRRKRPLVAETRH